MIYDAFCDKLKLQKTIGAKEAFMKENGKRFLKIYSQGMMEGIQIWVYWEKGVQYLFQFSGYSGGVTPLLDAKGAPVILTAEELAALDGEA